eukprot:m.302666 g.302666  ORF g.302666 m.302666 type:complete len:98 (-) comp19581_c0_seq1:1457-1750(-)
MYGLNLFFFPERSLFSPSLRDPSSTFALEPSFHVSGAPSFASFFSHFVHTMLFAGVVEKRSVMLSALCCRCAGNYRWQTTTLRARHECSQDGRQEQQ